MTTDGPLQDGVMGVATDGLAPVADEVLPVVPEAAPVAGNDTPPASVGDILGTEGATPTAAASPHRKPASVLKRVRAVVAWVLLLAVLGAAGIAAFALVQGTWMVTPVLSGSMRPGLPVGGVVISEEVPVKDLAVRDVIVFRNPNKPSEQVVHRIIRITRGAGGKLLFNTQGDANRVRDPWTLSIVGTSIYRVRWSVPLVGYVAIGYQNHHAFFLLGAGLVLIIVAVSVVYSPRRRRRRHAKRSRAGKHPAKPLPPQGGDW